MHVLLYILPLVIGAFAENNYCYNKVQQNCASNTAQVVCNANYGNFKCVEPLWNDLFKNYLMRSNEYLLIKTNFDNYEFARPGFGQFYNQMSDNKWDTAKRVLKYVAIRDGKVEFGKGNAYTNGQYELFELDALGLTVDYEKQFAIDTNEIHKISSGPPAKHDMDVAWYALYKFAFQQSGILRQIVGYVTELTKMMDSLNFAVSLNKFDDFLADECV